VELENLALTETGNFPIRHKGNVHNGKVRSVYWLNEEDSKRIIGERGYNLNPNTLLGIMIISDRISAFDVIWHGEQGLNGIPGKGASLNAISKYWFDKFDSEGLAGNHILEVPHPLAWIVQKAEPILVEAIARKYITGSMLRDYKTGVRNFCGVNLPEGLMDNQRLPDLLITPTTKGDLSHIEGLPKGDDANLTRDQIIKYSNALGFKDPSHVDLYENLLKQGFNSISQKLESLGQIFVDTKFEFGYVKNPITENMEMIYIDEIGTPDSSRIWDSDSYNYGLIIENSKEGFRQFLLNNTNRDVLLDKKRMDERRNLARGYNVPVNQMMETSETYTRIAESITSKPIPVVKDARTEILDALSPYKILNI
jgi:phosphoribosylaminoimidazole-succinocarboxamide synthase